MKKYLFFIISLFFAFNSFAQKVIQMEPYMGVYKIPCTVNGARMKMIFDTGASAVSLSLTMAQYLYDNDYITDKDFIGQGQNITADGSIVNHIKVNLKDVAIGEFHVNNVEAMVLASQNAPLLFGQSAIQKLGKISIDGNNLIILESSDDYSEAQLDSLTDIFEKADKEGNYIQGERIGHILYDNDYFNDFGKMCYAFACCQNENYNQALKVYKELLHSEYATPKPYNNVTIQINLFSMMSDCYMGIGDAFRASDYTEESVKLIPKTMKGYRYMRAIMYHNFATLCNDSAEYSMAKDYYWKALGEIAILNKISTTTLWNICLGKIKQKRIIDTSDIYRKCAYLYAYNKWMAYIWTDDEFYDVVKKLARNGNEDAKIFCNANNLRYK